MGNNIKIMNDNDPIKILKSLSMSEKSPNGVIKLDDHAISEFSERKKASDWFHMGCSNISIGQLIDVITMVPNLCAPRTGHLGNWHEIARGRSGTLDHNFIVCGERKLGYPLIYDFNQIEDDGLTQGDSVYLPGSLVEDGHRKKLKLFHWRNGRIKECDGKAGLFSPFMQTPVDGNLISLVSYHTTFTQKFYKNSRNISSVILENQDKVKDIIVFLVENALNSSNPEISFRRIIDRYITLEGNIHRANVSIKNGCIYLGEAFYETSYAMVDTLMLSYLAATTPEIFFNNIKDMPANIPLISITLNSVILAILNTHYPNHPIDRQFMTKPCNPHMEWGAFGKSGFPPKSGGYYRSKVHDFKKLYQLIIDNFSDIDPIFYLLLPSTIFVLLPNDIYQNDVELLGKLFKTIYKNTLELHNKPNILMDTISSLTRTWVDDHSHTLSSYYKNKFTKKRCVFNGEISFAQGKAIEPMFFRKFSLQQASMLVGAMKEELTRKEGEPSLRINRYASA